MCFQTCHLLPLDTLRSEHILIWNWNESWTFLEQVLLIFDTKDLEEFTPTSSWLSVQCQPLMQPPTPLNFGYTAKSQLSCGLCSTSAAERTESKWIMKSGTGQQLVEADSERQTQTSTSDNPHLCNWSHSGRFYTPAKCHSADPVYTPHILRDFATVLVQKHFRNNVW